MYAKKKERTGIMAKEKTVSKKLTLYPKQIDKIKLVAEEECEGIESQALRKIINKHELESEKREITVFDEKTQMEVSFDIKEK